MAGWSPQEPTKTGYDSIVRTKKVDHKIGDDTISVDYVVKPADPERAERWTGFYFCGDHGRFNRGGKCQVCGKDLAPLMKGEK